MSQVKSSMSGSSGCPGDESGALACTRGSSLTATWTFNFDELLKLESLEQYLQELKYMGCF